MNDLAVSLALAATLALLPLLPTGPQHLALSSASWAEAALVLLLAIWLATFPRSIARTSAHRPSPADLVIRVFVPFLLAVSGAAVVGLARDNPLGSAAFRAQLAGGWPRLFAPMNQAFDPLQPLRVWLTLVEGPLAFALVAAICRRAANPARRARMALWGTLAGVLIVSVFAIVQYLTRFHLHPYWVQANPNLTRSHSTLEDPNALGSYAVLALGVAAALAFDKTIGRGSPWSRVLAVAAGVLAAGALLTTVSRAAWAAAAIAGVGVTAYGPSLGRTSGADGVPRYQHWARRVLALGVALLVVWMAARLTLPQRPGVAPRSPLQAITSTIDPRVPIDEVLKGRELFWVAALRMARRYPIAGVGLGEFPRLLSEYSRGATSRENAHDFFLQMLAETGITGLAAFLLVVVAAIYAVRCVARDSRDHRGLAWGLSFGGAAFLLTLLSGHPLLLASMQLVLGTVFAAGLMATDPPPPASASPSIRVRRRPALVLMSSLVIAIYAVAVSRTSWDSRGDPWGYNWGLYNQEVDSLGQPFRWAAGTAELYSLVPPGADAVLVSFAPFPHDDGSTTTVTVRAGATRLEVLCTTGDWRQVRLPLDVDASRRGGVEVRLDVDRVTVPAASGASDDTRALGFRLKPLEWRGARPANR